MLYLPINGLRLLAIETGILAATFAICLLGWRFLPCLSQPRWLSWLLAEQWRAVLFVIVAALIGRALLLPMLGVPSPHVDDEYSYLLMADTFAHHRLTNPTPQLWQHFETFHVNITPSYHSKYPVSQGLALALGEMMFHQPWIGVYLSTALMCGAICWALQAFLPAIWALAGGLLAVLRIALFSYWMNSYWGGSVAALGGALAIGALARVLEQNNTPRRRAILASTFALALLILATSRPYEGFAFAAPLVGWFIYKAFRQAKLGKRLLASTVVPAVIVGAAGLMMMGYYNLRTTGNPLLLPHILNERTYSPLPLFVWQRPKTNFTFRDPVFAKFYFITESVYGYNETNSTSRLIGSTFSRFLSSWFFYVGPALSFPVLLGVFVALKEPRARIVALAALSMAIALALCIYTMQHYAAPATVVVYLFAAQGLHYLWAQRGTVERAFVMAVCLTVAITSLLRLTPSAAMNSTFANVDIRKFVEQHLDSKPEKQLVLVSYDLERHYPGNELVHNWADFDSARILWARSKGLESDKELCQAYSDRHFWSIYTDDVNFSLTPIDLCQHP